jgi:hypothetical protein
MSAYQLREQTLSTLNVEADRWDGKPGFAPLAFDAYGRPLRATVTKGPVNYNLELRSVGPDGLPQNHDDQVVTRSQRHGESTYSLEASKSIEEVASGAASGVIKGIKKGIGLSKKPVDN